MPHVDKSPSVPRRHPWWATYVILGVAGLPLNSLARVTRGQLTRIGLPLDQWNGLSGDDPEDVTDGTNANGDNANGHQHDGSGDIEPQDLDSAQDDNKDGTINQQYPIMTVTPADLQALGRTFGAMMIRLEPFDGSGNATEFLSDLERYFEDTNKNTDKDKINCLLHHLSGEARLWFRTQTENKYNNLKDLFQDRFGITTRQQHSIRTKIYSCRQLPWESFKSFVGRIQQLARQIDMTEAEILPVALHGARPELRTHLSMAAPKTLSALLKLPLVADEDNLISDVNPQFEVLNAAMTEQMTKLGNQIAAIGRTQQQRSRPSYRRPQQQQRNGTSPGKFFKPAKSPSRPPQQQQQQRRSNSRSPSRNNCSKCGYDTCRGNPCPAWGKTCYKCGRPNHLSRCCRTKVNFRF